MRFHGITGEQGEASNKRGVIGYSVQYGSWHGCDKSQVSCGRSWQSWQAGTRGSILYWYLKTVLSPFGLEPPLFSEKTRMARWKSRVVRRSESRSWNERPTIRLSTTEAQPS
jgi:hypothetical protein